MVLSILCLLEFVMTEFLKETLESKEVSAASTEQGLVKSLLRILMKN